MLERFEDKKRGVKVKRIFVLLVIIGCLALSNLWAQDLKVGDLAPLFKVKTDEGKEFDLGSQKGRWTILYFFPKAGTPGCTKQAISFRDEFATLKSLGINVYGISTDTIEAQANFKKEHHLNFTMLADPAATVVNLYGLKQPYLNLSKRWSFIIGPDLRIRFIENEVDVENDAKNLIKKIYEIK